MSLFSNLRGIVGSLFQIGGPTGPQLKNNAGALEGRNAGDSTFCTIRGDVPRSANDLSTKRFADDSIANQANVEVNYTSVLGLWTIRTSPTAQRWRSVCYGNSLFVAVAVNGTTEEQIMTSPDGVIWTAHTSPNAQQWSSICYGNGLFVAVAYNGTVAQQIMTSPNGVIWTAHTSPNAQQWQSVCYGNGLFVAVASNGTTAQQIMTSPDGVTWTAQTSPNAQQWTGITYGNGLFVAVALDGTTAQQIMTSPNGVAWTARTSPNALNWWSVCYANGYFVAVAFSDADTQQIMTAPLARPSANAQQGTVTLDVGGAAVPVAFTGITTNNFVALTLSSVGGTQGPIPSVIITPRVGFSVTGTALDTSTYFYRVI
jgi:hypothetical protein